MSHAIQVHRPGGPEELRWEEVEVGEPGPGEVKLRQDAVGLNFIDVYHRTGLYPQPLPFTPGTEGAGVIESVGPEIEGLKPGDRVGYAGPIGSYAEQRVIAADRLVKLPDSISTEQAAAIMLQGMTAEMLLRRVHQQLGRAAVRPLTPSLAYGSQARRPQARRPLGQASGTRSDRGNQ